MTTTFRPRRPSDTRRGSGRARQGASHRSGSRQQSRQRTPSRPTTRTGTRVVGRAEEFSAARIRRRIGALVVVMALCFSAVIVRLVFVQGLSSS
ncbi:MAG: hypothetical protein JO075_12745, partial [Acidimicrobiia bacterium]|nr:hypothetical protein [Acidimicrobiia bacterium]